MANFNPKDSMDKLLLFFVVAMSAVILFSMGADVHERDWTGLATGGVTVAFFLAFGILIIAQRVHELKQKIEARDRDIEMMRSNQTQNQVAPAPTHPAGELKELLEKVVKPGIQEAMELKHDREMLQAILDDMGYSDTRPDDSELPKIEAAFHENTDRYVHMVPQADGMIGIEFSDKPFVPGRSDAHEAARLRGDAEKAKATTPADKPLTPAQQRRKNEKAGHGAITDAELREKRLAERRKRRAEKKATEKGGTPTTTTTTTLPGQTGLPGVE